ncbi:MAG: GtrA family protein [Thiohalocapsa sp.]
MPKNDVTERVGIVGPGQSAARDQRMWTVGIQFLKFAGLGGIGTLAHYAILILLMELVNSEVLIASSLGALTGAVVNYALNYRYTFRSQKQHKEALSKFLLVAGVGFMLNLALMAVFTYPLGWAYLWAQAATTLIVLVWNFLGNLLWTFAH